MVTKTEDVIRLIDITDSINEILGYLGGADYNDFSQREDMREGIMAQLGQIGGAAALLSDEFKEDHGEIDWDVLKGLQFSNAEDQLELDHHSIWYLVHEDLPVMNEQFSDLITELEDDEDIEGYSLNLEDQEDISDRYRSKEVKKDIENQEEDIRYQDETPPSRKENETDRPEENYIESSEQRKKGPFHP